MSYTPNRAPFSNVCPMPRCGGECYGVSDDPTERPIKAGVICVCTKCRYSFTHRADGSPREFTDAEIAEMARLARIAILRDALERADGD